jgi:hypothetical protein
MSATTTRAPTESIERTASVPLGQRAVATSVEAASATDEGASAVIVQRATSHAPRDLATLRALQAIRPRHFPRVFGCSIDGDAMTIRSELLEGEPLADLASTMSPSIFVGVLLDVLAGLGVLHTLPDEQGRPIGALHRDVTPANVIVCRDGIARLVQLAGGATRLEARGADELRFVAPEILLGDENIDRRADLYAVGVMLWERLAGRRITAATRVDAIVSEHLAGRIGAPPAPNDPDWLAALVPVAARAVATDPTRRFEAAGEMADALRHAAGSAAASRSAIAAFVRVAAGDRIVARAKRLGVPLRTIDTAIRTPPPMAAISLPARPPNAELVAPPSTAPSELPKETSPTANALPPPPLPTPVAEAPIALTASSSGFAVGDAQTHGTFEAPASTPRKRRAVWLWLGPVLALVAIASLVVVLRGGAHERRPSGAERASRSEERSIAKERPAPASPDEAPSTAAPRAATPREAAEPTQKLAASAEPPSPPSPSAERSAAPVATSAKPTVGPRVGKPSAGKPATAGSVYEPLGI